MNGADKIQMAELEAMKKSALAPHETRLATCRGHAGVIWIANQGWKMVESKQVIGRKRQSRPQFPGAWHGYTSSAAQSRSLQWNSPSDGEAGLKAERLALQEREKERQPSPTTTGRHQAIRDKASMQTPGATVIPDRRGPETGSNHNGRDPVASVRASVLRRSVSPVRGWTPTLETEPSGASGEAGLVVHGESSAPQQGPRMRKLTRLNMAQAQGATGATTGVAGRDTHQQQASGALDFQLHQSVRQTRSSSRHASLQGKSMSPAKARSPSTAPPVSPVTAPARVAGTGQERPQQGRQETAVLHGGVASRASFRSPLNSPPTHRQILKPELCALSDLASGVRGRNLSRALRDFTKRQDRDLMAGVHKSKAREAGQDVRAPCETRAAALPPATHSRARQKMSAPGSAPAKFECLLEGVGAHRQSNRRMRGPDLHGEAPPLLPDKRQADHTSLVPDSSTALQHALRLQQSGVLRGLSSAHMHVYRASALEGVRRHSMPKIRMDNVPCTHAEGNKEHQHVLGERGQMAFQEAVAMPEQPGICDDANLLKVHVPWVGQERRVEALDKELGPGPWQTGTPRTP